VLRIGSIVWGVRDVRRAVQFWCDALGYKPLREHSEHWAILVPREGIGAQMSITKVSSTRKAISATTSTSTRRTNPPRLND